MKKYLKLLVITLGLTSTSLALSPADLWYTRDQQGKHAFESGDMQHAAELFNNPQWKGSAAYKSGDYAEALAGFESGDSSDDYYNKGNTLAFLQRYEESIKAYDQALELNPDNKDAEFNREIVKKLLQKQKQEDKQDQNKPDQDKKDQQPQDQKNNAGQGNSNPNKPDQKQDQKNDGSQQNKKDQQQDQKNNPQQNQGNQNKNAEQNNAPQQQDNKQPANQAEQAQASPAKESPEEKQAKKWLAQIPDDPGGLLQQKFLRDHQRMAGN